ncbi:hypothetical protein H257_05714 [Aphanomyces astaci]|uniref:Uncharacterized protein n=1 Tax=Aphanomyces astaci TaxID=112090 RepID=W4GP58_APHAT|nr:hypothetical protein H257_05714 [Aphanomyces astaci]ETV81111.1 hypothetical protein H257_05714 [Aphanomyces astaci]|eukprot:XP_009828969.1 hypothetical protein H257_05714 [Aphanomyces astaci]
MQYTFPEHELTLYLAKLADGEWLPGDAATLVRLSNGHLDEDISKYLNPSNRMLAAMGLNYHKHFGMEVPPRNVVHVLVRVPSARWDEVRPQKKHKVSSTEAVKGVQGATSIPPDVIASIQGALGLFPSQKLVVALDWAFTSSSRISPSGFSCDRRQWTPSRLATR